MDKKTTIILIILILILGSIIFYLGINIYKLKVVFLNAGKADSIVLKYNNTTVVIDTGEEDFYYKLDNYLYNNNIKRIDYLIITHFDKDHVGSASKLIDNYEIGSVYQTELSKDSEYYYNYTESLNKKNITPIIVNGDKGINIDKFNMVINGPDKIYEDNQSNNSSLIVSVKYKNKSYLFMGDAMNDRIEDYINNHSGNYDVIKMPYHGNYLKNDEMIIKKYNPKQVIISSNNIDKKLEDLLKDNNILYTLTSDSKADSIGYSFKNF